MTRGEGHARRFLESMGGYASKIGCSFVIAFDRCEHKDYGQQRSVDVDCSRRGIVEDALVMAHEECGTDWIFRLDDDESIDDRAVSWLGRFMKYPEDGKRSFGMSRLNLFGSENRYIVEEGLYPDYQTRLLRSDINAPSEIHESPPADYTVDWPILHHKFLVKTYEQRRKTAEKYDSTRKGAGFGDWFLRFSLPEDAFSGGPNTKEFPSFNSSQPPSTSNPR